MDCLDPEESSEEDEHTIAQRAEALKEAIKAGRPEMVEDLLDNRADIQHRYAQGLTPLHLAVVHEKLSVVRLLMSSRADPLAKTTDDAQITPLDIANLEEQQEIFDALCKEALPSPFWRRFAGPLCLLLIIAGNYLILAYLHSTDETFQLSRTYHNCIIGLALASILGLILANILDPGTVGAEDVAYAYELARLPSAEVSASRNPAEEAVFRLIPDGKDVDEEEATYRWCRTCRFWKPPGVSHCAECGKCFWRMDHHCWAIGNCVALRNHRFFFAMVGCGCAAWLLAAAAVAQGLGQELRLLLREPTWPMLLAVVFLAWSALALSILIPFACFHFLAIMCNITSKSTCGRRTTLQSRRLNQCSEYKQILCSPVEFRPCEGQDADIRNVQIN